MDSPRCNLFERLEFQVARAPVNREVFFPRLLTGDTKASDGWEKWEKVVWSGAEVDKPDSIEERLKAAVQGLETTLNKYVSEAS